MKRSLMMIAIATSLSAACGSSSEEETTLESTDTTGGDVVSEPVAEQSAEPAAEPPPPQPMAVPVRVVHAAANASRAKLGLTAAEGGVQLATELAFGAMSERGTVNLQPGANGIGLTAAAEGFEAPAYAGTVSAGEQYTAVVYADAEAATGLQVALVSEKATAPSAGFRARLFHAVHGWGNADVCVPGENARAAGTPVIVNAPYGRETGSETSAYVDVATAPARLQVREANAEAPCSGRVLGAFNVTVPEGVSLEGQNVTFFAIGRGTGRPAVPRKVLACTDAPATAPACFELAMAAR